MDRSRFASAAAVQAARDSRQYTVTASGSGGRRRSARGNLPPSIETVDLPGGTSVICYQHRDPPEPVGEIEVRLPSELTGTATVLRLDPDGASRLAAALTHTADRTARRGAG